MHDVFTETTRINRTKFIVGEKSNNKTLISFQSNKWNNRCNNVSFPVMHAAFTETRTEQNSELDESRTKHWFQSKKEENHPNKKNMPMIMLKMNRNTNK